MKASEAYRIMADMAERTGAENLTNNLVASFISHLAVDLGLSREAILKVTAEAYDALQPSFQAVRDAAAQLKPGEACSLEKIETVSDAGISAILELLSAGKVKS